MSPSRYKMLEKIFEQKGKKRNLSGSRLKDFIKGGIIAHTPPLTNLKNQIDYGNGRRNR